MRYVGIFSIAAGAGFCPSTVDFNCIYFGNDRV